MVTIIGSDPKLERRITCYHCASIMTYLPVDVRDTDDTDEGTTICGFNCPKCGTFLRTNP